MQSLLRLTIRDAAPESYQVMRELLENFESSLRGCPQENHAKPCRRCYRLDHRIGLFSVCKYTWVHYFQIRYDWGPSSFPLCIRGGVP